MYHGKELSKPSATKNQQNWHFELRTIEVEEQLRRFPWPKPGNPLTSRQWICSLHSIIIEKRIGRSKRCSIFLALETATSQRSTISEIFCPALEASARILADSLCARAWINFASASCWASTVHGNMLTQSQNLSSTEEIGSQVDKKCKKNPHKSQTSDINSLCYSKVGFEPRFGNCWKGWMSVKTWSEASGCSMMKLVIASLKTYQLNPAHLSNSCKSSLHTLLNLHFLQLHLHGCWYSQQVWCILAQIFEISMAKHIRI